LRLQVAGGGERQHQQGAALSRRGLPEGLRLGGMDPADVTKVAREETSEWLKVEHPIVEAVRPKLFGGWEGNWVAFNTAHDVALPSATQGGKLGFFMYPQAETAPRRRDLLAR